MKRRNFLLKSAALGLFSQFDSRFAMASTKKIHQGAQKVTGAPAPIDNNRLEGRNTNRSSVVCRRGAVATSQSVASTVGVEILKSGGNAIDAAVAMNAMMSLVEPMGCGPGGRSLCHCVDREGAQAIRTQCQRSFTLCVEPGGSEKEGF